ncbi:MAG: glycosyltransferase family 4 protein [Myxococcota bacterium]
MRILFLSHYFPPEVNAPASRTHEHARRWVADGHEVTVVTGVPNHPSGVLFPGWENRWIQEDEVDGIRVIRTWMFLVPNEGFLRRSLNYLLFALTAILASRRVDRPDVVVATSPQFFCGLAGAVVARLKGCPFVLEVRDLWPESIVALGQLRARPLIRVLEFLESWLYRNAAGVVVNTRSFVAHIQRRGVARECIEVVYNGIDRSLFRPQSRDPELLRSVGLENRFVVAYIGTLGMAHGLMTLVDCAEKMRDREEVRFLLIGDGAEKAHLEREIQRRGLTNVQLLGLRPRDEIPIWIASVDVLLVLLRDLPVFGSVIPSKGFEFLAQEKPVIVATPRGEFRDLMEKAEAAYLVEPERGEELAAVIDTLRSHPEDATARARNGRKWVEANFSRDDLALKMASFLELTARRWARGSR